MDHHFKQTPEEFMREMILKALYFTGTYLLS